MNANEQALVQAVQDLSKAVNDHEAKIQEQIDAAVAAHENDDQAAFDNATAQITALTKGIVGQTGQMAQAIANQAAGVDTSATGQSGNALGTTQPASNTGLAADISTSNQNAGGTGPAGAETDPGMISGGQPTQNNSNQQ